MIERIMNLGAMHAQVMTLGSADHDSFVIGLSLVVGLSPPPTTRLATTHHQSSPIVLPPEPFVNEAIDAFLPSLRLPTTACTK